MGGEARNPFIIGTAGHIDHGKTVLVKALSGIDTDRLREEKERGISIDLGFAPLTLADGTEVAIVDVPGHERFIKNMLAGATGVDLLLLVVAADDGVMPQTLEHMAIADLLGIEAAVVAITKADKVSANRLPEVEKETRQALSDTRFALAPIVKVAALQGDGLNELLAEIAKASSNLSTRTRDLPWRLPVDRVFTITGAGTVVTGTLWSGELTAAQAAEILPGGRQVKIRSLQIHGHQATKAKAGQRVAVNLSGIAKDQVKRGDMLAAAGWYRPTYRADAILRLLPGTAGPLKNEVRVRLHHGTKETFAHLRILGRAIIEPGEQSFVQLKLDEPIPAYYGDHFIIRKLGPAVTIGGGRILDSQGKPVNRREEEKLLAEMEILAMGRPDEIVRLVLRKRSPAALTAGEISAAAEMPASLISEAIKNLSDLAVLRPIKFKLIEYYLLSKTFGQLKKDISGYLAEFHQRNPYLAGVKKEELRGKLLPSLSPSQFDVLLEALKNEGELVTEAELIRATKFTPGADEKIKRRLAQFMELMEKEPFAPPPVGEIGLALGLKDEEVRSLINVLKNDNEVILIGELVFSAKAIEYAKERLVNFLKVKGEITVSEWRQLLGTSRKYALPLLEYFDKQGVTKRVEDVRVLA